MEANSAGLCAEALAAAVGALGVAAIFAEHDTDVELVFLALHLAEEAIDAFIAAVAVEDQLTDFVRELMPGDVHGNAEGRRLFAQVVEPGAVFWAVPGVNGAVAKAECLVRNDEVEVVVDGIAEALAAGTGAEWIVEAEEARFGLPAGPMATNALIRS